MVRLAVFHFFRKKDGKYSEKKVKTVYGALRDYPVKTVKKNFFLENGCIT